VRFIARQYNYFATRAETPGGSAQWVGVVARGEGEVGRAPNRDGALPSSLFAKQSAIRIGLAPDENNESDN